MSSPKVLAGTSFINIAVGILAIVIGAVYLHTTTCDGKMMRLPIWLLVVGCVSLIGGSTSVYTIHKTKDIESDEESGVKVNAVVVKRHIGSTLIGLFLFAWNIVGAVALSRDAMPCKEQAEAVWIVTLVILCIQWLSIALVFLACCCGCICGIASLANNKR